MSTDEWLIDEHLCRCCHSVGKFKSLTDPMIENELLYIEALRTCMDIKLSPVAGPLAGAACSICDACAARLQEVYSFRTQVLRCEESFQSLNSQNRIKVTSTEPVIIKEELPDSDGTDFEDNHEDSLNFHFIQEEPKKEKRKKIKPPRVPKKRGRPARQRKTPLDDFYHDNETQCGKTQKNVYRLLVSDYEKTGDIIKCTRCSKTFNSFKRLRVHVKSQHIAAAKYNCTICNTSFKTLAPFTKHKLDEHNIDDRSKCDACDSIFNTDTQLRKHKNSFHMLGKKLKCPLCEYECFSFQALYKHKFRHKTVKDYHCKFCRKSFLRKATLDLHERIHTGDRRKVCAECGQAFVQKASLNYHMMKYHPEVKF